MTPAVDLAPYRCPPSRPADRRLFATGPEAPPKGALREKAMKAWVDGLQMQVRARNAAGRRVLRDYAHCRGQADASPAS